MRFVDLIEDISSKYQFVMCNYTAYCSNIDNYGLSSCKKTSNVLFMDNKYLVGLVYCMCVFMYTVLCCHRDKSVLTSSGYMSNFKPGTIN